MTPETIVVLLNANRHDGEGDWAYQPKRNYYWTENYILSAVSAEIVAGYYFDQLPPEELEARQKRKKCFITHVRRNIE